MSRKNRVQLSGSPFRLMYCILIYVLYPQSKGEDILKRGRELFEITEN